MPRRLEIRTVFSRERRNDWRRLLIQGQNDRMLIFPGKVPSVGIPLTLEETAELVSELQAWLKTRRKRRKCIG